MRTLLLATGRRAGALRLSRAGRLGVLGLLGLLGLLALGRPAAGHAAVTAGPAAVRATPSHRRPGRPRAQSRHSLPQAGRRHARRLPAPHQRRRSRRTHRHPAPRRPVTSAPAAAAPAATAVPAALPLVTLLSASGVTDTGLTLTGTVVVAGEATQAVFEWGTSPLYGQSLPATTLAGTGSAQTVSARLTGLAPGTTYHVRLVATDCAGCQTGTSYGEDMTVTTRGYENPVWAQAEAADPSVLDNGNAHDDYWAFTTGDRFPILHSPDLIHWTTAGLALAQRPGWAITSGDWHPWAPHVVQSDQPCPGAQTGSCYLMYYVSVSAATRANCVAVATATSPGGPYSDRGPLTNGTLDAENRPVGCGDNAGYGQIDPSVFVDPASGASYLYVSEDFACPAGSSSCTAANSHLAPTISVIPLSPDGLSASGPRTPLFSGDPGGWEAAGAAVPTVEGPMAIAHDGTYYLLYSGGSWRSQYAMGYATAGSPLGPFSKVAGSPILSSAGDVIGPGGGDTPVTGPKGGQWLVYHGRTGTDAAPRVLRIDPFTWTPNADGGSDIPTIGAGLTGEQPVAP